MKLYANLCHKFYNNLTNFPNARPINKPKCANYIKSIINLEATYDVSYNQCKTAVFMVLDLEKRAPPFKDCIHTWASHTDIIGISPPPKKKKKFGLRIPPQKAVSRTK